MWNCEKKLQWRKTQEGRGAGNMKHLPKEAILIAGIDLGLETLYLDLEAVL